MCAVSGFETLHFTPKALGVSMGTRNACTPSWAEYIFLGTIRQAALVVSLVVSAPQASASVPRAAARRAGRRTSLRNERGVIVMPPVDLAAGGWSWRDAAVGRRRRRRREVLEEASRG